jgi:hypothetical protein
MKTGSYVVCIDDNNWDPRAALTMTSLPVKDHVYRVRRIIKAFHPKCPEDGLALEGIYGEWTFFISTNGSQVFEEYHFRMSRFREIEMSDVSVEMQKEESGEVVLIDS